MSHHDKPLTLLGDLTPADFLANYWQQKPLLIRGAIPDFVSPIDHDELAGRASPYLLSELAFICAFTKVSHLLNIPRFIGRVA